MLVLGSGNTMANVLVRVVSGLPAGKTYPAPTAPVTMDQHGCQYRPHIFGIQVGQPLRILNSDGTLHNIHALPKKNAEFNIGQPFKNMETIKKFEILDRDLTVEEGDLTPSLKLKRRVVERRYADVLDGFYQG